MIGFVFRDLNIKNAKILLSIPLFCFIDIAVDGILAHRRVTLALNSRVSIPIYRPG